MRDATIPVSTQGDTGNTGIDIEADESMSEGELLEREHSPNDWPVAVDDFGTTAEEQRAGEPLDLRLARELPDPSLQVDVEYVSEAEGLGDAPTGRLVEHDEGAHEDEVNESVAYDVGRDDGGRSAEEAAMHTYEL